MKYSPIFNFLESLEPYTKVASTAYGMLVNYRQNKKIESVENDVQNIKDILGLNEVILSDNELKIISIFIEEDIDDLLISLESYDFFDVQKCLSNNSDYRLKYEIFINSNLLQNIFNKAMTYSELFKLSVNFIYDNYRKEDILYTNKLIEEISLNNFLINPILYHLDLIGVIKLSKIMPKPYLIADESILNKANLMKLHRSLN